MYGFTVNGECGSSADFAPDSILIARRMYYSLLVSPKGTRESGSGDLDRWVSFQPRTIRGRYWQPSKHSSIAIVSAQARAADVF